MLLGLNQSIVIGELNKVTSNALIRNLAIFILYILILDVLCIIRIIKNKSIVLSNKVLVLILSAISSLLLPFDGIYSTSYRSYGFIFNCGLLLVGFISFILIISNLVYILNGECKDRSIKKFNSSIYFLIPFVALCSKWITKFPASMTFDSHYQLEQIASNHFNDVHPAAHTLFTKLLLQIYDSPATVVFFQILFLCIATWYAFKYFENKRVSNGVLLIVLIIWSCLTPLQETTCYLWKDVFYSVALLFTTIYLIKIIEEKNNTNIFELICLGISLAVVFLFRHNGLVPVILTVISLIYITINLKNIKFILPIILAFSIIIPVKTVVYDFYKVEPNTNGTKYAIVAKAIVSVVANDGNYTENELKKIEEIMPYDVIKRNYSWSQGNNLIWNIQKDDAKYEFGLTLDGKESLLIELFIKLLPKNFFLMAWDVIGSASIMWQFDFIKLNFFSMHMLYLLPLLIISLLIIRKKKIMPLLALIPMMGNVLSIVISNISYEARYGYSTIVIFGVLFVYCYYIINVKKDIMVRV